ncbi:MAG: hypothetical protein PGN16_06820 [Sphingomonas phyllosphaerae]|uniref:hypothetical protein n=1 Tax=Sphingomonas phyllosphaerae TaxID=257003 RepID=UPI002FFB8975
MVALTVLALAFSGIAILGLCIGDPKRRRAAGATPGTLAGARTLLTVAACIPGVICLFLGEAAAFMLWFGGSALGGWSVASYFASRSSRQTD